MIPVSKFHPLATVTYTKLSQTPSLPDRMDRYYNLSRLETNCKGSKISKIVVKINITVAIGICLSRNMNIIQHPMIIASATCNIIPHPAVVMKPIFNNSNLTKVASSSSDKRRMPANQVRLSNKEI